MKSPTFLSVAIVGAFAILLSACSPSSTVSETPTATPSATASEAAVAEFAASTGDCAAMAATFRAVVSANPDSTAPELVATCNGDALIATSNGIPDYPYVATTPGELTASEVVLTIPSTPTESSDPEAVPALGPLGMAVNGVAIYGATEGTGGDVLSLEGALSECGGHEGPVDYHMHLFGWADGVDCLYDASEVEAGTSLVMGWAADGYPIMSGVVCSDAACGSVAQLTSSWQLTDSSLFASDTWSAHSFVEGSGDLDQCNGRIDSDGQYRYYATATFPYTLGCFHGTVADGALAGTATGGDAGGPGGPPGADG
ncbi:YHYH protein [Salinibacterium sp. G-O1]|uniref:YHYH protein n=1 Tax=Salinibacterium sp. G-O1 TaxID=3046208 RepID=UPI0024B990D3|nr:YHYH protein [Salinibacterium sp. G-O1]MDJ0334395.1 YHYH protein [Salinibacterium sp. G-O1]